MLPTDYDARKEFPLLTVLTAYFPDAIEALVELCKQGNKQHTIDTASAVNPFKLPTDRVIWDRSKSTEQTETAMRHLWDHQRAKRGVGSVKDADGHLHIIKSMWRCAAEAQLTIEADRQAEAEVNAFDENYFLPVGAMNVDDDVVGIPDLADSDIGGIPDLADGLIDDGKREWQPKIGDRVMVTSAESTLHWRRGNIAKIDDNCGFHLALDDEEGVYWFEKHELAPCA